MKLKSVFTDFDDELIDHLQGISDTVIVPAGELMLRPRQHLKSTILVLDGTVKMYLEGGNGEEYFLYFLEAGNACALSILCLMNPATDVKARALTDVTALMIPFENMDNLIRSYPKWCYFLLQNYHSRFEELLLVVEQIAFHSMDEKLVFYLKQQFRALKSSTIAVTHQQIALDLNSSREVISRLLKKLELDNRILISRNEITNISL